jgi:hypothetical protein
MLFSDLMLGFGREYTLEEDLALIQYVEDEMRRFVHVYAWSLQCDNVKASIFGTLMPCTSEKLTFGRLPVSACEAGDKQKVKDLLKKGATFTEWSNCTDTCTDTMFQAQWEVRTIPCLI